MNRNVETIREKLHQYIDTVEERKIQAMYIMFEDEIEEDDVDLDAYNKDIDEAEKEIEQGNFFTHQQVLSEIKTWKKKVV